MKRIRESILAAGVILAILVPASGAQDGAAKPLARFAPREHLGLLVEWEGLDTHGDAWKQTAAYKMLTETTLGEMLRQVLIQSYDGILRASGRPTPMTGAEAVGVAEHLVQNGFLVAVNGAKLNQPESVVVVARSARRNATLRDLPENNPMFAEPQSQAVARDGRTIHVNEQARLAWWYEGDDLVLALAQNGQIPALDALAGKVPSAADHPARAALAKGEEGTTALGWALLEFSTLPEMPPQAKGLGLDGIERIGYRWAVSGDALVGTLRIEAPSPRRGMLALFDQPPLDADSLPPVPERLTGYTVFSLDPNQALDVFARTIEALDPNGAQRLRGSMDQMEQSIGIRLRQDLLAKLGPRMAFVIFPPRASHFGGLLDLWLYPPKMALVVEVRDRDAFLAALDRAMATANERLERAGGLFVRGAAAGELPRGVGSAEFRRLPGDERGYVLTMSPAVLPLPAGLRPTILVGRRFAVLAVAPDVAREAIAAEGQGRPKALVSLPEGTTFFAQDDPRNSLPEFLANIPSIVQIVGALFSSRPGITAAPNAPFALLIDPDTIPNPDALRPYLFPRTTTVRVSDRGVLITTREAFPGIVFNPSVGTSTPVLVALLLPAVQAAREAARRAQCVNNLKQIELAMLNFESANGHLPGDIRDADGKPLLSWRVAILPFIEQHPLFEQFHLDEPWDSEHNKRLLEMMPLTYMCPSRTDGDRTVTSYLGFTGKGTVFEEGQQIRIASITDGTSNTISVVEARVPVPWTKPEDLPFDPERGPNDDPFFGAGSNHPGGFNAAFVDGSVRFIKLSTAFEVFKALITRNGGEVIGGFDLP
jgi:prepilin-type processing-associated H-X9-DG protein